MPLLLFLQHFDAISDQLITGNMESMERTAMNIEENQSEVDAPYPGFCDYQ